MGRNTIQIFLNYDFYRFLWMISFVLNMKCWQDGNYFSFSSEETDSEKSRNRIKDLQFVGWGTRVQIEACIPYVPNTKLQIKLTVYQMD